MRRNCRPGETPPRPISAAALFIASLLACTPAFALDDEFAAPLSSDWSAPRTAEPGSSVTAPVADEDASDGQVLELVYPGGTSNDDSGPAFATELETSSPLGYGSYRARFRTAKASRSTGLVSAFFTYFNDGGDHDSDGIVDNHEIDIEILANEPSAVYMSVWTEYQDIGGVEKFYKTTRKVDLRTGLVWETPPGGEGSYDLVEAEPLGWTAPRYKAWRAFATYRFDWSANTVEYSIDLGDGQGFRTLWTLTGAPNIAIPSHPAPLLFNLWHNAFHWSSGKASRVPRKDVFFDVDSVSMN